MWLADQITACISDIGRGTRSRSGMLHDADIIAHVAPARWKACARLSCSTL